MLLLGSSCLDHDSSSGVTRGVTASGVARGWVGRAVAQGTWPVEAQKEAEIVGFISNFIRQ